MQTLLLWYYQQDRLAFTERDSLNCTWGWGGGGGGYLSTFMMV